MDAMIIAAPDAAATTTRHATGSSQNVRLMKALTAKGYDVNYSWGMNLHGQKMGGAILPEMMRWLWRDGPVSTDPKDMVERGFREPAAKKSGEAAQKN